MTTVDLEQQRLLIGGEGVVEDVAGRAPQAAQPCR